MTVAYYIHFILNRHQVQYILVYPLFFRLKDFFGSLGWKSEARLSVARIGVHAEVFFFCAKQLTFVLDGTILHGPHDHMTFYGRV
jgi:hypothetical protein